jgi:hypothetical protein
MILKDWIKNLKGCFLFFRLVCFKVFAFRFVFISLEFLLPLLLLLFELFCNGFYLVRATSLIQMERLTSLLFIFLLIRLLSFEFVNEFANIFDAPCLDVNVSRDRFAKFSKVFIPILSDMLPEVCLLGLNLSFSRFLISICHYNESDKPSILIRS